MNYINYGNVEEQQQLSSMDSNSSMIGTSNTANSTDYLSGGNNTFLTNFGTSMANGSMTSAMGGGPSIGGTPMSSNGSGPSQPSTKLWNPTKPSFNSNISNVPSFKTNNMLDDYHAHSFNNANNNANNNTNTNYSMDNLNYRFQEMDTNVNVNAPTVNMSSFVPQQQNNYLMKNNSNANSNQLAYKEDQDIRIELKFKETKIHALENELSQLKSIVDSRNNVSQPSDFKVPANYEILFKSLSSTLNSKEEELKETKLRLEALLTAITLNPSNTITENGRYDEMEISHKIILKLKLLQEENESLLNLLSFGKSKEKDIEIGLLKSELSERMKEVARLSKLVEDLSGRNH